MLTHCIAAVRVPATAHVSEQACTSLSILPSRCGIVAARLRKHCTGRLPLLCRHFMHAALEATGGHSGDKPGRSIARIFASITLLTQLTELELRSWTVDDRELAALARAVSALSQLRALALPALDFSAALNDDGVAKSNGRGPENTSGAAGAAAAACAAQAVSAGDGQNRDAGVLDIDVAEAGAAAHGASAHPASASDADHGGAAAGAASVSGDSQASEDVEALPTPHLDGMVDLVCAVSRCTALTRLDLHRVISDLPPVDTCSMLRALTALRKLSISIEIFAFSMPPLGNGPTVPAIIEAVAEAATLEFLDMSQHSVMAAVEATHLTALTRLTALRFGQDCRDVGPPEFTGLCADAIAKMSHCWPRLLQLDLGHLFFGDEDMVLLAEHLTALSALQALRLREHRMRAKGTTALANALQHLPDLRHLDLTTHGKHLESFSMGADAAQALGPALATATRLRYLSLAGAGLSGSGIAKLLADCAPMAVSLAHLNLSDSRFSSTECHGIVEMLDTHAYTALACLRLKGCELSMAHRNIIMSGLRNSWGVQPELPVPGVYMRYYPGSSDFCSADSV